MTTGAPGAGADSDEAPEGDALGQLFRWRVTFVDRRAQAVGHTSRDPSRRRLLPRAANSRMSAGFDCRAAARPCIEWSRWRPLLAVRRTGAVYMLAVDEDWRLGLRLVGETVITRTQAEADELFCARVSGLSGFRREQSLLREIELARPEASLAAATIAVLGSDAAFGLGQMRI